MSTFDSTKESLSDIIKKITEGKIQLPEFQRGWVWDDEHVRSLLTSVARSFPIGAVMLLGMGGKLRFQVRPIQNVPLSKDVPAPEQIILDGQQRLTSLTQVLALEGPVKTFDEKKNEIERYYYIDIEQALGDDTLENAFVAIREDRKIKTNFGRNTVLDLSTPQKEYENFYFPCNQILDSDEWENNFHEHTPEKWRDYIEFRKKVLDAFRRYQLPVIPLKKDTSKEAVCLVFEKVNTGGVPLNVFELVTASFAAENFNLREDWFGNERDEKEGRVDRLKKEEILETVESTDFLQAVSLRHTYEKRKSDHAVGKTGKFAAAVSAKRVSILALELNDYQKWANDIQEGFLLAARFMRKQCFFTSRELPYRSQLVPLAVVLATIKERWLEPRILDKLTRWYWCGVLGELYGGSIETRIANDLEELLPWLLAEEEDKANGILPRTVTEAAFQSNRLNTLRTRNSAAYKGLSTLILREGAKDFFLKETVQVLDREKHPLHIHHIFPKAWCRDNNINSDDFDSIINKTSISSKTNGMIGHKAPSDYLVRIQKHPHVRISKDDMNDILASHYIDADSLRGNNFKIFFERRRDKLLDLVENAMGKSVERNDRGG